MISLDRYCRWITGRLAAAGTCAVVLLLPGLVRASVTVSLQPATATLYPTQTQALSLSVTGDTNAGVNWTLAPAVGALSTTANGAVYAAPAVIPSAQAVTVTATSIADATQIASTTINLVPLITVAATPAAVTLYPGKTQQFNTTVTGTLNQNVTWSLSPAVGSISSNGLYTAPASITTAQTITLTARSAASSSSLFQIPITLKPSLVQFTVNAKGLTSLAYEGRSYFYNVPLALYVASFQTPSGSLVNPSLSSKQSSQSGDTVTQVFPTAAITLKASYSAYDQRTIECDLAVTNNDPVNILASMNIQSLGIRLPGPATNKATLTVNQYNGSPVTFLSGNWGSVAMWMGDYPIMAQQVSFGGNYVNQIANHAFSGPNTYTTPIPPGQTIVFKQWLRFGSTTDTAGTLAPEAYAAYRAAQPYQLTWSDHRPIAQWFIADAANGRSNTNPRGYLWDKKIDITDASTFQSKVLAKATQVLNVLNGMTVRPQGIIIWDLEGQEFNQPFTYVGYPNNLPLLAPEMDAVADQVMGMFTGAGYRVGVTIRPQYFGIGSTLPTECNYNSDLNLMDKFVNTSAVYPNRGYWCASPNTWYAASANHLLQSYATDATTVENLLASKITYAKQRWGATLFYIDTDIWEAGSPLEASIFQNLQAQFPDCLLIPEISTDLTFGSTAPLEQAAAFNYYGTTQRTRFLYPEAFGVVNTADVNFKTHFTAVVDAVTCGDILMFRDLGSVAPEVSYVQQAYALAPRTIVPGCSTTSASHPTGQ